MIKGLALALLLTLFIELAVSFLLGVRGKANYIVLICANLITNPAVNVILYCVKSRSDSIILYVIAFAVLEVLAVIVEYLIFKKCLDYERLPLWLLSIIINAASFAIGTAVLTLI